MTYQTNDVTLYQSDCNQVMDELITIHPTGLFDMIFADSPYFLSSQPQYEAFGRIVNKSKGDWDKSNGFELDFQFNYDWISKCRSLLKPNGTMWMCGTHHNIYQLGCIAQQLNMKLLNHITWEKTNPPPNFSCRYFTHSTETLIWVAKDTKSKYTFNYADMRKENGDKQMKSVWTMAAPSKSEKMFGKHPTQKPLRLVERCILASTKVGDIIFDPFNGSGTTGVGALKHKRKYVGVDINPEFLDITKRRLNNLIEV